MLDSLLSFLVRTGLESSEIVLFDIFLLICLYPAWLENAGKLLEVAELFAPEWFFRFRWWVSTYPFIKVFKCPANPLITIFIWIWMIWKWRLHACLAAKVVRRFQLSVCPLRDEKEKSQDNLHGGGSWESQLGIWEDSLSFLNL